ncbi:MAG: RusA family crossover junction endodeoxyribonuclease [Pseudomonadota bacterium]
MTAARIHRIIPTPLDGDPVECGALSLATCPPSLNNLFINSKRGRFKSPEYRAWQAKAGSQIRRQCAWHVPGPITIALEFGRSQTKADLDNLIKPILDILMATGRISDDRNVMRIDAQFVSGLAGTRIEIRRATAGKVAA